MLFKFNFEVLNYNGFFEWMYNNILILNYNIVNYILNIILNIKIIKIYVFL